MAAIPWPAFQASAIEKEGHRGVSQHSLLTPSPNQVDPDQPANSLEVVERFDHLSSFLQLQEKQGGQGRSDII